MIHAPSSSFVLPDIRVSPLEGRPSIGTRAVVWLTASSLTLGLHVGVYWMATRHGELPPPPPPELAAAIMIDLTPIDMTAPSEVDNAADGPAANEQEALEEAVQAAIEEAVAPPVPLEPLPEIPPPPPDVKPEAVLAPRPVPVPERPLEPVQEQPETPPEKPKKVVEKPKKPVEKVRKAVDKPKPKVKRDEQSQVATKRGGSPRSDNPRTNDRSAAPTRGGSARVSSAENATWQSTMRRKIIRAKRFPSEARGRDYGTALVSVTFGSSGAVTSARLLASSGSDALDREAVAVMHRASPFPPPPGGQAQTLRIPMNFNRR